MRQANKEALFVFYSYLRAVDRALQSFPVVRLTSLAPKGTILNRILRFIRKGRKDGIVKEQDVVLMLALEEKSND